MQLALADRRGHLAQPAHPPRSGAARRSATIVGVAGVVLVFVAVLSIGEGFRAHDGDRRLATTPPSCCAPAATAR